MKQYKDQHHQYGCGNQGMASQSELKNYSKPGFKLLGYLDQLILGPSGGGIEAGVRRETPPPPPSDIRLKTDIQTLGMTPNGHQLYRFKYLDDPEKTDYVGVMAQDVLKTHPDTVTTRSDGYYAVYYDRLALKMTTYKQWKKHGLRAVTHN